MLVNNERKLYVDQVDMETNEYLNNILSDELKDYEPGFLSKLYDSLFGIDNNKPKSRDSYYIFHSEDENPYYELNDDMIKIIKMAKNYFDKAGIKVDEYDGRISFYSDEYNSMKLYQNDSDIHCDNEDMIDGNTCIFYTEKTDTLNGGNLNIYPDYDFSYTTNLEQPTPSIRVDVKPGKVAVFDGDLYHCPQPCTGFGYRNRIIVNLTTKTD
jgi:hypothetical protein